MFLASLKQNHFQWNAFISFQFISMYIDKYSTDAGFVK